MTTTITARPARRLLALAAVCTGLLATAGGVSVPGADAPGERAGMGADGTTVHAFAFGRKNGMNG